jgi:zinc-ribbon domain
MKTVTVLAVLSLMILGAVAWGQVPDSFKPAPDSVAPGDTLRKIHYIACPKCGRANYEEANYCIYCGEPLKQGFVRKVEEKPEGPEKERDDPASTRLFLVPTGETLKKRTGYLGDSEILFLLGGVGLADALTLFGGSTIIPGHLDWQVVFGGPKFRLYKRGNISAAIGGVGAFNPHWKVVPWAAYGVATFGKTTGRLNVGVGKLGYGTGPSTPWLFSLGGEAGKSNRSRWLWESWLWQYENREWVYDPYGYGGYSEASKEIAFPTCLGLRFFGDNISGDLGLIYPWSTEGLSGWVIGFPLVNVTYHFK